VSTLYPTFNIIGIDRTLALPSLTRYLRHSLAHGLLHDGDPYSNDALYGCWLIFHLCMLPLFPYRTHLTLPFDEATSDQATATN
jgi:hypothetical protein